MNIRDLKYFIHLAESLSFTKTAEAFYVSQPSISIALKRLEENFETTLIQRNRAVQNVQLTESGEILYRSAHEILQTLDRTKQEIINSQAETVSFGFLPTIGGFYLPKILPDLAEYSMLLNFIEEESSEVMFEMIRNNQVSSAIISSEKPIFEEKWLTQVPMEEHDFAIYVNKNHKLADRKSLSVEELEELDFITLGNGYTHNTIMNHWVSDNGLKLKKVRYSNEIQTINSMIDSGIYAGFMTDIIIRNQDHLIKVPVEDAPKVYTSLIINNETPVTAIQKKFNDEVLAIVNKLYTED
ncbi:MAG TPA: LysR family transcriptional regulator [Facklamia tabacinasalis]|uniref:LysR family transcriptional regulator n=1 Tax=Ruoffia tabacinasalis TaxID=87458 RepID=UPI001D30F75E|nr:LysR family transcriptional regulator [Ruoffia tabacinasalis]